ncbi:hypothetical protein RND81_10G144500 [Saponaria officinalis]|uniref:Peptidase A1 domain-containing protein n=1 Tax=Saponaria officinalis TaxID=3572 RepID=A0AAW1I4G7_SAPOF
MAIRLSSFHISLFLGLLIIVHPTLAIQKGFTTNLIHRESPLSPLKTQSLDKYERLRSSIQRSMSKINQFSTSAAGDFIKSSHGEYAVELSYGTPPVPQLGLIDTASSFVTTQCHPIFNSYTHTHIHPIFNPLNSSTYKVQNCPSKTCHGQYKLLALCGKNNTCEFVTLNHMFYVSRGEVATETITFKSITKEITIPQVIFGCVHNNYEQFKHMNPNRVGLANGPLSLISQFRSSFGGKFSYCFIPFFTEGNYTSKINFGANAEVSGSNVISTPIVKKVPTSVGLYYLTLNGFSVGTTHIPFYSNLPRVSRANDVGNIIVDTGMSLTYLPEGMFNSFRSALEGIIKGQKVQDPNDHLDLCYKTNDGGADLNIPNVIANFVGGDLILRPYNTFILSSDEVLCLAMAPFRGHTYGYLGNIAQVNILVGYDTVGHKMSFKPTDCTMEKP